MSLVRCSATIFLFVPCFYSALLFRFLFFFLSFFRPFTMLNHSAGWLYAQPSSFISLCVTFCYTLVPWPPTKSNGRSELEGQEEGNNKKYISVDSALFVFLFLSQIAIHAKQRTGFSFVFVCWRWRYPRLFLLFPSPPPFLSLCYFWFFLSRLPSEILAFVLLLLPFRYQYLWWIDLLGISFGYLPKEYVPRDLRD